MAALLYVYLKISKTIKMRKSKNWSCIWKSLRELRVIWVKTNERGGVFIGLVFLPLGPTVIILTVWKVCPTGQIFLKKGLYL